MLGIKLAGAGNGRKSQEKEINSEPFYLQRHLQLNKRLSYHHSKQKQSCNSFSLFNTCCGNKKLGGKYSRVEYLQRNA